MPHSGSTRAWLVLAVLFFVAGCSHQQYYSQIEQRLGTQGRTSTQHHIAAYYPSGIALNFPGYLIGIEDSAPDRVSREGDLVIDNPVDAGSGIERITNTMRQDFLPFISHIIRYQGRPYGAGNCALYNLYQNGHRSVMPFCHDTDKGAALASDDPQAAYRNSWQAIDIFKQELSREVASGKYSHMIIAMMGVDTAQEESVRNFRSLVWSIRETAGEEFRPLFIGITWPCFIDSRWFEPIWELLSYPNKADEADRLGLSWIGVLMHEVIIPLSGKIRTSVIAHSYGARALSMATCVGPAIINGDQPRQRPSGQIEKLIGLGAAFSLERMRDSFMPFYEDINYPNACDKVKSLVITTTQDDSALKLALWADLAGNYNYYDLYCKARLPYRVYCATADSEGTLETPYDTAPKLFYIDTSALMRYTAPGTQGGSHSDIFRPEVGRMLWSILENHL